MGRASRQKKEAGRQSTLAKVSSEQGPPLYESNLFWGSLGVVVAIILTVIAATVKDLGWLLWTAWPFSCVTVWAVSNHFAAKRWIKLSCFLGGIVIVGTGFYGLNALLRPNNQISTAIFMECQVFGLPITIPPRSTIHVIPINRKRMQSQNWGFYAIPNHNEKEKIWPDQKALDLSNKSKNFGVFGYKCEVSNHGAENIIYLAVPIDLWFDNNKKAVRYAPIISSLDAAQSFSFYILNDCPIHVSAAWQDTAKVQTLREPKTHEVPLRRKYRNPAEQIMVFFPSSVQWVREQPCE